jgi:hypothetical protein
VRRAAAGGCGAGGSACARHRTRRCHTVVCHSVTHGGALRSGAVAGIRAPYGMSSCSCAEWLCRTASASFVSLFALMLSYNPCTVSSPCWLMGSALSFSVLSRHLSPCLTVMR